MNPVRGSTGGEGPNEQSETPLPSTFIFPNQSIIEIEPWKNYAALIWKLYISEIAYTHVLRCEYNAPNAYVATCDSHIYIVLRTCLRTFAHSEFSNLPDLNNLYRIFGFWNQITDIDVSPLSWSIFVPPSLQNFYSSGGPKKSVRFSNITIRTIYLITTISQFNELLIKVMLRFPSTFVSTALIFRSTMLWSHFKCTE